MRIHILLCLVVALAMPVASHANILLKISGLYQTSSSGQGAMSSTTRMLLDAGGYWVSQKGWLIGALYGSDDQKSDGGSLKRTSMGPSFGWLTRKENGFFAIATYHYTANLTGGIEGSGYQADLGYKFDIRKVGLALQFSYKHFDFNKAAGAALSPPYKSTQMDPYVGLLIEF